MVASAATVVGTSLAGAFGKVKEGFTFLRSSSIGGSPKAGHVTEQHLPSENFHIPPDPVDFSKPGPLAQAAKSLTPSSNEGPSAVPAAKGPSGTEVQTPPTAAVPAAAPTTPPPTAKATPAAGPKPKAAEGVASSTKSSSDMFTLDDLDDLEDEVPTAALPTPAEKTAEAL
eukprot:jgi/Botrbrau1/6603/Bobra.0189s0030.1